MGHEVGRYLLGLQTGLSSSVGKDNACCQDSRVQVPTEVKIFNFPHHLLLSDYRGVAKWFGAHYNKEVSFSSEVERKKGRQVLTTLLNQW